MLKISNPGGRSIFIGRPSTPLRVSYALRGRATARPRNVPYTSPERSRRGSPRLRAESRSLSSGVECPSCHNNGNYFMRITFLFFCLIVTICKAVSQGLSVDHLKCEYKTNPLGIERTSPKLSWQLQSNQRSILQTAYRILVSDDSVLIKKNIGNILDSKRVNSDQSINVSYRGKQLQSASTYYWKVMVWDNKNHVSAWSRISKWQMGLFTKKDWKSAQWIAYEKIPDTLIDILPLDGKKDKYKGNNVLPMIRKSFVVRKPIILATAFICGLGQFELSVNGSKVGDHFLDPGWTKYDKQALYVPFDVTRNLQDGENVIGVMLGNGFYYIPPVAGRYRKLKVAFGYPKMICRIAIEYADGTSEDIVSDKSWKTDKGPITFSSIYGGEDYDARLEQDGWDRPGFHDNSWKNAIIVDGPQNLNAQITEPIMAGPDFPAIVSEPLRKSRLIYDIGQNASGIPEIKVSGNRGDTVRIIPAELLNPDGSINQKATGAPFYFQYVLKGEDIETWQPRFTYYGYRYLQIIGAVPEGAKNPNALPTLHELVGLHPTNTAQGIGSFICSNKLFNETFHLIDWSIRSNMMSVLTDCPHREKLGWLEQAHLMGNSIRYKYDVVNLYRKQLQDMKYSQTEDGLIPEIAPEYVKFDWSGGIFRDSPEWGSNAIITPWDLYRWYGDTTILRDCYEMMTRYISYLKSKAKSNILSQGLGDWYDLGPKPPGVSQLTPMGVTGTAIYYYDLNILSKTAALLTKEDDAKRYTELAAQVKRAFNDAFFHQDTKQYATGSQTANAMAVYMNLVDPEYKDAVIENIVKDIRSRNNSLTAGDIGYHYLLSVLHDAGRDDVIYDMNSNSDVPGYGYQIKKGATALTESWAALPTNSNNHLMLGHLMEWFFDAVAGISQSDSSVAFKNIIIAPRPVGNLTSAKGLYTCRYGEVTTNWEKRNDLFHISIYIPENTTATVYLPSTKNAKITEGKKPLKGNPDVKWIGYESGKSIMKIGSGLYVFDVKNYE